MLDLDTNQIDRDLGNGWGFPVQLYSDADWYALEQTAIFDQSWYYIGTTHSLTKPGDMILGHAGRIPVVVTRGMDGALHALINVCRHRGHPVCREQGNHKTLSCPYHGWTYGLDGALRGAPGAEAEADFDKAAFGLPKLPLAQWGPLVFVAASPDAKPLREHFPAFDKISALRDFDLSPDRYAFHRRYSSTADANWKIWYDNTLECFHCPHVHGSSFNDAYAVDQDDYEILIEDRVVSYFFPPKPKRATNALQVTWNKHMHLFPGFFITQQDDIMLIHQMRPLGPGRTTVFWDMFAEDGADLDRVEGWCKIWEDTLVEDKLAVEAVQSNVFEGTFRANRYMKAREPVPLHINDWIWSAVRPHL